MPRILIRNITPKRKFNYDYFEKEFRDEMRGNVKKDIVAEFGKTVEGWENKPGFDGRITITRSQISLDVFPTGPHKEQYKLVDAGSPPHPIVSRRGKMLKFRSGYRSATRPRVIGSRRKQRFGGTTFIKQVPKHPGFEGREFFATIAEGYKPDFKRRAENALRRAARR